MRIAASFLVWTLLFANSAYANMPPPTPPNPVALEKARESLSVSRAAEYIRFGVLSKVEQHVGDRLLTEAGIEANDPFGRLLAETFRHQAREGLLLALPSYVAERAERFARLMSPDQLDAATTFFRSDAGQRIAQILFGDSDSAGLEQAVFLTLTKRVPATVAEVRRSAEMMHKVNER